jgi:Zn-finger nucleic acid-binding protein
MNCRNCGAAMELFERRRYYFCRYCGSFHFIDTAETDGVRVLEQSHDALPCPVCAGTLAAALLDDTHPVRYCEQCRGVLVPRARFVEAVHFRRAWTTTPPTPPVPLDKRELDRQVVCPSCRSRMDTHPYYGPGNVVIDTCAACDVIWLDYGELKQITDAPGGDRGRRNYSRASERAATVATEATSVYRPARPSNALMSLFDLLGDTLWV